jgi:uncharacterized protein (TIGR03437 family)
MQVSTSSWDSPSSPAKVYAELAVVVNWGAFVDPNRVCRVTAGMLLPVSAASFIGPNLAPSSIASVFGETLAPVTEIAPGSPLPTSLGGVAVTITDAQGVERAAPLYFTSPAQINFVVPPATAPGRAAVKIFSGVVLRSSGSATIESISPAVFTASASGTGVAAANLQRVHADGSVAVEPVFSCTAPGTCAPRLLEIGPDGESDYLTLYATGLRGVRDATQVAVTIAGGAMDVLYAGPQPQYQGMDQVNVRIPPELRGSGIVEVQLTAAGKAANIVQVGFR